jgi:hypothetical protein
MDTPLTQEQIDYVFTTTNTRGAAYTKNPYSFSGVSLRPAPSNNYLAIYVALVSGGGHEASKNTHGSLDGTVSDAFKNLVDDVLTDVERHI